MTTILFAIIGGVAGYLIITWIVEWLYQDEDTEYTF